MEFIKATNACICYREWIQRMERKQKRRNDPEVDRVTEGEEDLATDIIVEGEAEVVVQAEDTGRFITQICRKYIS